MNIFKTPAKSHLKAWRWGCDEHLFCLGICDQLLRMAKRDYIQPPEGSCSAQGSVCGNGALALYKLLNSLLNKTSFHPRIHHRITSSDL